MCWESRREMRAEFKRGCLKAGGVQSESADTAGHGGSDAECRRKLKAEDDPVRQICRKLDLMFYTVLFGGTGMIALIFAARFI